MRHAVTVFVVCVPLAACAPKRLVVAPAPSPAERLAAADALVRAGCLDCLAAAFREYDALRSIPAAASPNGTEPA